MPEETETLVDRLCTCCICGGTNKKFGYTSNIGDVCDFCDGTDKDAYVFLNMAKRESKARTNQSMHNITERLKITDRVKFINEGTCLLDDEFYYYAQKRKARVKGTTKQYQMRGFQHFIDVFGKNK